MMKQLPLLPLLLLFSLLTGNSSACTNAVSKVISTEGTDVILPCFPSTRENLLKKLFDWKKVGERGAKGHEVFMWDSRDHYKYNSGQSEQFKGRVSHFQDELEHGNASIIIRKTKVIDSGSYTCVFPRSQPSEEFCIELIVGASPKPNVKLLDKANSWARLQCEVHGAHPEPKVEWRDSSGNILPAEEPQVLKNGESYDVTVNVTVTKTDRYRCVATQEEINHQIFAEILVHISGEEPEQSSGSNTGWIIGVLCAVLFVVLVVLVVVVYCIIHEKKKRAKENSSQIPPLVDETLLDKKKDSSPVLRCLCFTLYCDM